MKRLGVSALVLGLVVFSLQFAWANSKIVRLQKPILTALALSHSSSGIDATALNSALTEVSERILKKEIEQREAVETYMALHTVSGRLRYLHTPISWEQLSRDNDGKGIEQFVAILIGQTRDLSGLGTRISCPQDPVRTLCILTLSVFDTHDIKSNDIPFKAIDKAPILSRFLNDVALNTPTRMSLNFRSEIRFDVASGRLLDDLPSGFSIEKYRVYDDVVKTGVTSAVLPASARGHQWLYERILSDDEWAISDSVEDLEIKVSDNVLFPARFEIVQELYDWSLSPLNRVLGERAMITDRSIRASLEKFDRNLLRRASDIFVNYEDIFVQVDVELKRVDRADTTEYVNSTDFSDDYWDPVTVFFMTIANLHIRGAKSKKAMKLPIH